ncbi:MAG: hypothetical protein H0V81_02440 [Solirubrobacterales bacterium]|nr:hypothetical protein [Solirubrobacterales bacterium]
MRPATRHLAQLDAVRNRVAALVSYDAGRVSPASARAKRRHLLSLFQERSHSVLVESGTFLGGTVKFFLPHAERIVTVEIDDQLHRWAAMRFADEPKVEVLHGDALTHIPRAVATAESAPLIWLDGHYSGHGTGQGAELEPAPSLLGLIAEVGPPAGTTLLVDDVRLFGAHRDFPTLHMLLSAAFDAFPAAQMNVELDSLVIRLPA